MSSKGRETTKQTISHGGNDGDDKASGGHRRRQRQRRRKPRGNKKGFKAITKPYSLEKCIFRLNDERSNAPSFADCLKELKLYCDREYSSSSSEWMRSIFDPEQPTNPKPPFFPYEYESPPPEPGEPSEEKALREATQDDFNEEIAEEHMKNVMQLRRDMQSLFNVIMAQCSTSMRASVEESSDFDDRRDHNDCVWLLQRIRGLMWELSGCADPFVTALKALRNLVNVSQSHQQNTYTVDKYIERIRALDSDLTQLAGLDFAFKGTTLASATGSNDEERQRGTKQRFLGCLAIKNADPNRFSALIKKLADDYALGRRDVYPDSLEQARQILKEHLNQSN